MNRKLISNALTQIDEELIAEALVFRGETRGFTPERTITMEKHSVYQGKRSLKKLSSLLLAACLILALAVTAYAANLWGIRDMRSRALPESAEKLIEPHDESGAGEGWSARITEVYCDASSVLLTVTVSGGNEYLLAPTDATADDPLWVIGRDGDGTLGEYAKAQGKELLLVNAGLPHEGENAFDQQSKTFKNVSDNEITVLISASKPMSAVSLDTVCTVVTLVCDTGELQRVEIPFTLTESGAQTLHAFTPVNPDAVDGLHVEGAVLTETPLGIRVELSARITGSDPEVMKVELDGLTVHQGAIGAEEDGTWRAEFDQCEGAVGNTLTARFYGWDKQLLGEITFDKIG